MTSFRNILLPLDIADEINAERALDAARLIATANGGNVHLLHVKILLPRTYRRFVPAEFEAAEQQECEEALSRWTERLGLPEHRVSQAIRRGPVAAEVLNEADERGVDLIIIGSNLPTLASRFMGSNASAIVRDAKVNVLVLRAEDQQADQSG